jgi:hypothetical protein
MRHHVVQLSGDPASLVVDPQLRLALEGRVVEREVRQSPSSAPKGESERGGQNQEQQQCGRDVVHRVRRVQGDCDRDAHAEQTQPEEGFSTGRLG